MSEMGPPPATLASEWASDLQAQHTTPSQVEYALAYLDQESTMRSGWMRAQNQLRPESQLSLVLQSALLAA